MDKWLSGEGSFKRVSPAPAQDENGVPVEEVKKVYESSSIEELRNRIAEQLKTKETKKKTLQNSFLLLAVLALVLAVASAFLLARVGVLQGQNQSLNKEVESLKSQIQSLERENKNIQSRIDMAEREKEDLKGRIDTLAGKNESLEQELRKNQTLIGNATEEKTYLEDILITKTKEIDQLKKNTASGPSLTAGAAAPVSADLQSLSRQLKEKDAEIQRLSDQNRILSDRIEKLYKITNDKIAAINVAKITLEETIAEARKNIDNEWSTVDLGSIQASQKPDGLASNPSQQTGAAKKEGHVLAINEEHGFVVVDLGKANGIDSNTLFTVRHNGEVIATLTVLEIRDVMSACNIKDVRSGKRIAINDPVSIQK